MEFKEEDDFVEIRPDYADRIISSIGTDIEQQIRQFREQNSEIQNEDLEYKEITLDDMVTIIKNKDIINLKKVFRELLTLIKNEIPYTEDFKVSGFLYELTLLIDSPDYDIYSPTLQIISSLCEDENFAEDFVETECFWEVIKNNLKQFETIDKRKIELILINLIEILYYSDSIRDSFVSNQVLELLLPLVEKEEFRQDYAELVCLALISLSVDDFFEGYVEYVFTIYAKIYNCTFSVETKNSLKFMVNISKYDDFYNVMTEQGLVKDFISLIPKAPYSILRYVLCICSKLADSCPYLFTRVFKTLFLKFRTSDQKENIVYLIAGIFMKTLPNFINVNEEEAESELEPYKESNFEFIPNSLEPIIDEEVDSNEDKEMIGIIQISYLIKIAVLIINNHDYLTVYSLEYLLIPVLEIIKLQNPYICQILGNNSVITALVTALEVDNPGLNCSTIETLMILFDLELNANGTHALFDEFTESDGVDTIEEKANSENEQLSNIAIQFLQKLTPPE